MNAVNLSVYLNHSRQPNLKFDDKDVLRAIRAIPKGEELTIDYDESFDDQHDFSDDEDEDFSGSDVDPKIGVPGQRGKTQ
jgi:SET domain-containing protein